MAMAGVESVEEEILVRLDVEDVLRCKSVCKSWYFLISSPYFVKAHLKHNLDHRKSDLRISTGSALTYQMVGSSNGLVCISTDELKFVVSNPSTRESRELAILPEKYYKKSYWGFGYDSRTDDYKVVVGAYRGERHIRFIGLTLRSNIWKFIGDVNYVSNANRRCGVLHNGALHWFMDDPENNTKKVIVSFDLSVEEFKAIPPPDDKTDHLYRLRLGVFEECLCIFMSRFKLRDSCVVTWAMKKDNSWQLLPHDGNERVAATCAIKIKCHVPYHSWRLYNEKGLIPVFHCWLDITLPKFVKTLVSLPKPHPNRKRKNN